MDEITEPDNKQLAVLLISVLIVALCGIAYELIIGTVSSYLLGNSVYQFSLTIGLFMFAMGIGSYLSRLFMKNLVVNFIIIELVISFVGGISSLLLFMVFPYTFALYSIAMYTLIIIIGSLVGLEIPILTRILSHKESIKDSIAKVLSLDYIGALIGSVLFPLVLLPHLGLIRSSFAIGLINAFTAFINIYYFRNQLKHARLLCALASLTILLMIVLTVFGTRLTSFAENKLYFDQVIFRKQTPYQRIVYTKSLFSSEKRLYIDGHIQYCDRDEYRYHESLVHPSMSLSQNHGNILILGGGDGLAAREILKYPDVEAIHIVDIDPEITRFCSTFPEITRLNKGSLKNPKVTVYNKDAFSFINRPGILYDLVIIDLPDPHNEALNKLYSREFYTIISRRIKKNGLVVTQSSSPFYTRKTYWCIERTLAEVFSRTYSYQITVPSFGIWGFHIASQENFSTDSFMFTVPTRYISNDSMKVASIFAKDTDKTSVPVNTMLEPKLFELYLKELDGNSI